MASAEKEYIDNQLDEIRNISNNKKRSRKMVIFSIAHAYEHPGAVNQKLDLVEYQMSVVLSTMVVNMINLKNICKALIFDFSYIDSYRECLRAKVQHVNLMNPKLAIEIHLNSFSDPRAKGYETLYCSEKSKEYAEKIHSQFHGFLGVDRGIKERNHLYFLNATTCPALILEPLFISNRNEAIKLRDENFLKGLSERIVSGIREIFN